MSLFPATARFLESVKTRLPLEALIAKRIKIDRKGREFAALCPFHEEKTPSFWISPQKGFYHCFGCGAHGDHLRFIQEYDKRSFREALEILSSEAGIPLPRLTPEDAKQAEQQKTLESAMAAAAQWYQSQLYSPAGALVRSYLAARGLEERTLKSFGLGYAPEAYEGLKTALLREGYSLAALIDAGLLINIEGKAPYDRFRGRLMIPIRDRRGAVIAFGGRAMGADQEPKYLNSPETPLFHKGSNLYAQDTAFAAMRKEGKALLVEGYFDVIALHQAGIPHVVAPLGTALTEDQIRTLWHQTDTIQLCFDGDKAGARASHRAMLRAMPHLKAGKTLEFLALPPGEDPDTLVLKGGAAAFNAVAAGAQSLSQFIFNWTVAECGAETPEQKAACLVAFSDTAAQIGDPVLKKLMLQELKDRFYQETRKPYTPGKRSNAPFSPKNSVTALPRPDAYRVRAQLALLLTLYNHPHILDECAEILASLPLSEKELDSARTDLLNAASHSPGIRHTAPGFLNDERLLASLQQEWPMTKPQTGGAAVLDEWLTLANALLAEVQPRDHGSRRRIFRF